MLRRTAPVSWPRGWRLDGFEAGHGAFCRVSSEVRHAAYHSDAKGGEHVVHRSSSTASFTADSRGQAELRFRNEAGAARLRPGGQEVLGGWRMDGRASPTPAGSWRVEGNKQVYDLGSRQWQAREPYTADVGVGGHRLHQQPQGRSPPGDEPKEGTATPTQPLKGESRGPSYPDPPLEEPRKFTIRMSTMDEHQAKRQLEQQQSQRQPTPLNEPRKYTLGVSVDQNKQQQKQQPFSHEPKTSLNINQLRAQQKEFTQQHVRNVLGQLRDMRNAADEARQQEKQQEDKQLRQQQQQEEQHHLQQKQQQPQQKQSQPQQQQKQPQQQHQQEQPQGQQQQQQKQPQQQEQQRQQPQQQQRQQQQEQPQGQQQQKQQQHRQPQPQQQEQQEQQQRQPHRQLKEQQQEEASNPTPVEAQAECEEANTKAADALLKRLREARERQALRLQDLQKQDAAETPPNGVSFPLPPPLVRREQRNDVFQPPRVSTEVTAHHPQAAVVARHVEPAQDKKQEERRVEEGGQEEEESKDKEDETVVRNHVVYVHPEVREVREVGGKDGESETIETTSTTTTSTTTTTTYHEPHGAKGTQQLHRYDQEELDQEYLRTRHREYERATLERHRQMQDEELERKQEARCVKKASGAGLRAFSTPRPVQTEGRVNQRRGCKCFTSSASPMMYFLIALAFLLGMEKVVHLWPQDDDEEESFFDPRVRAEGTKPVPAVQPAGPIGVVPPVAPAVSDDGRCRSEGGAGGHSNLVVLVKPQQPSGDRADSKTVVPKEADVPDIKPEVAKVAAAYQLFDSSSLK